MITHNEEPNGIGSLCKAFVHDIDSLADTLPFIMSVLETVEDEYYKKMEEFISKRAKFIKRTSDGRIYRIEVNDKPTHDKLLRRLAVFRGSRSVTPEAFFVALISKYDAYLGRLIEKIFYLKQELFNGLERTLAFSELVQLKTIDAAKEFIIEKEVEAVLRKSHVQQFDWMEKTFGVPLRKGLECWPIFVEATERRNLFVHTDGVISTQYLSVCRENGVKVPPTAKVGSRLEITPAYFETTSHCIYEIWIKLAHVLWRKLAPSSRSEADTNLMEITYDLLVLQKYELAKDLLTFATEVLKEYSADEVKRIFVINRAIAHKFDKEIDKARAILAAYDWTASADKFQLAVAVLRDEFDAAVKIMERIGPKAVPGPPEYKGWPLFREFRKSDKFLAAYKKIFGSAFVLEGIEPRKQHMMGKKGKTSTKKNIIHKKHSTRKSVR